MHKNNSPWLHELHRTRPVATAQKIDACDIAVVGAGIAGVTTAYFLLKYTTKKIALIDAGLVANGATGHNAGHLVADFERSLASIAAEFGTEMMSRDITGVENAVLTITGLIAEHSLPVPYSMFTEYAGYSSHGQLLLALEEQEIRQASGMEIHRLYIANEYIDAHKIPKRFAKYITTVPGQDILELLETKDERYIALSQYRAATANAALFVESLLGYMLATYSDRIILSEKTPVSEVVLGKNDAVLKIPQGDVTVERVILATNGFERITITNNAGPDIDVKFHHMVEGYVGYMAAYTEPLNKKPVALTYYNTNSVDPDDPYFYVTRRPYDLDPKQTIPKNLVAVGGPGVWLDESIHYDKENHIYPNDVEKSIKDFMSQTYGNSHDREYEFMWHGLMGFTTNYLRLVGPEPLNPVLWYNLGCNGVGVLTSVYGAQRIGQLFAGEKLPKSIFEPRGPKN